MKAIKKKNIRKAPLQKVVIFVGLIALFLAFSILSPNFLTVSNLSGILLATMINGLLACGATYIIINGGIDLSIGTNMTVTGVLMGMLIVKAGLPLELGVLCGVGIGALIGLLNGIMVTRMKLPPFIATLGMQMVTKGVAIVLTNGTPIYFTDYPNYQKLAGGSVLQDLLAKLGLENINIPNGVLIMFAVAIIMAYVLSRTRLGRYLYAIGSNREAARLSGVKVWNWEMLAYVIGGTMSGIAAVLMSSRLNSANPSLGSGYEMDAVAACVIGGASLAGGEGSISGTIIGAFIISVLTNGLRIMSVPTEWQTVLTGLIIIVAVFLDMLRKRKRV